MYRNKVGMLAMVPALLSPCTNPDGVQLLLLPPDDDAVVDCRY
jgi:hypothetical protein